MSAPSIELDNISIQELQNISPEVLDKMEFTSKKWICQCKGCNRGSFLKDYGAHPLYLFGKKWINIEFNWLLCAKHNKIYKRIEPIYGFEAFQRRFLDWKKERIQ